MKTPCDETINKKTEDYIEITILGCGSSGGVPRAGLKSWGVCDPENPKNRRRRCSLFIKRKNNNGETTVLIDTSPDLREQLISENIHKVDAVFYTHMHADHIHGIDDIRPLVIDQNSQPIPAYASQETMEALKLRFDYCFETPVNSNYPPIMTMTSIDEGEQIIISGEGGDLSLVPYWVEHGEIRAYGYRIHSVAYIPDVHLVPLKAFNYLKDLDLLILDALRDTPHPSHFSVSDALALIERVKPRQAILTNLNNDLDYNELASRLPHTITPAFDGMNFISSP